MFKLEKQDHSTTAMQLVEGNAFRYEGEIYVRIKTPKNFDQDKIYAVSLETWQLLAVDPSAVVEMFVIEAVSKPLPHGV